MEDGQIVEPVFFAPILPTILLNGASGIGTGWSTRAFGYHPIEVCDNVMAHIEGRTLRPMHPWAAGFRGQIEVEHARSADAGAAPVAMRIVTRGVAELTDDGILISELPLGRWTEDYREWLQKQMAEGRAFWHSYTEHHTERSVRFALRCSPEQLRWLRAGGGDDGGEGGGRSGGSGGGGRGGGGSGGDGGDVHAHLVRVLELSRKESLTNTHAFDAGGELRHFASPHELIELHAEARLAAYAHRRAYQLAVLHDELAVLEARARFIAMAVRGDLALFRRAPRQEVVDELRAAGFAPHLAPTAPALRRDTLEGAAAAVVEPRAPFRADGGMAHDGDVDGDACDAAADADDGGAAGSRGGAYEYLLRMPLISLTEERAATLERQLAAKEREVQELSSTSDVALWKHEIGQLRPALERYVQDREDDGNARS